MGKPTILDLLDTVKAGAPDATDAELAERVEAVLKLHNHGGKECFSCCGGYHDPETHPCPTLRALDGER